MNAYLAASPVVGPALPGAVPPAFVSSWDERRAVPSFLWAIHGSAAAPPASLLAGSEAAARAHLAAHAARYGLTPEALSTAVVTRVLDTGRGGIVVVLRQRVAGVEVFHTDVRVLMDRSLALVAIGGNLHAGAVPSPKARGFVRSPADALAAAFADLGEIRLVEPARVRPVYFPLPDRIVPAHHVEILGKEGAYAYVFAADDGRLLYRENLTHEDAFSYRVWADPTGDLRPADGPLADFTPHPTGKPDGSYPGPVPSTLISIAGFDKLADPWLPAGAIQSQGNNVDAYTDDDMPEGFSSGDTRALVTSPGTFDHTYDLSQGPQSSLEQREASVTQLFYVTNWLHDWWYDSGFDEKGGNAQQDNYGRGGIAGDPLLAEGQFQAPTLRNNSNMVVPQDGTSPRMHMFVWDGVSTSSLTLQPGNLSQAVGLAVFGPQSFDVTGAVVLANDGTAPDVNDACETLVNGAAVSGNVALVNRGNCPYKQKAVNAQAAGAVGVIVVDDVSGEPAPAMGDSPAITTAVTIPIVSVSQADGASIEAALPLTATLQRLTTPDRDGSIDNTVVAHEWGHYLHLRHVMCDTQQCLAESEGWADFDALMMILREGDDLTGTYAIAQYAVAAFPDDPAYFGIRRYPYSTDLGKSPLTFKYIANGVALPSGIPVALGNAQAKNSEVHAAGEIWASMLFEGYVSMLQQTAGSSPPYTFVEGRRRMSDYVVGGMTVAPVDPTYTEQRDAVLATAAAADVGDMGLLAQGFAKRGAGTCAVSPPRDSTDFTTGLVESFTLGANLSIASASVDDSVVSCDGTDGYLDAGETGLVTVHVINAGPMPLPAATATLSTTTPGITFPMGTTVSFGSVGPFASTSASTQIELASNVTGKQQLDLQVSVDASEGCAASSLSIAPFINVTEVPASSSVDDVEPRGTVWTTSGTLADKIWSRIEATPGNHVWSGIDYPAPSDTSLVSPPLVVSSTDALVMTFTHRHSFETSMGAYYDGGVIEISTDGTTWTDIGMYGTPGYGGTIGDPMNLAMNVLKGRPGYVATNPSWPGTDKVAIDMGTKLAGMTVQVRFRIGTDDATGDVGWQIDDIGFQGITNTPFASLEPDTSACATSSTSSSGGTAGGGTGGGGMGGGSVAEGNEGHLYASGGWGCRASGKGAEDGAIALGMLGLSAFFVRARRRRAIARRRCPG